MPENSGLSLENAKKMQPKLIQRSSEACRVKRWIQRLEAGLLRLDQQIQVADVQKGLDVTGRFWVFAIVHVSSGTIEYVSSNNRITPPAPFYGMYAPPYCVVEVILNRSHSYSKGLASARKLPEDYPQEPVVFSVPSQRCPASISEMGELIRTAPQIIKVGRDIDPSPLAIRIKEAIDWSYTLPLPLSKIAAELRISPAMMSRYFKKAYGMPPVHYRHHIRTMDGMMRLLDGEAVTDVFQQVGFDDLSRFYRHFKRFMLAPPGKYRF